MYTVLTSIVVWAFLTLGPIGFLLWLFSSIVNALALRSYGVGWWWVALIPFSHNVYKLYFSDTYSVPWWVGFFPSLLGVFAYLMLEPVRCILYLICNVVVNYVYGLSMYGEGLYFSTIPFWRYYIQILSIRGRKVGENNG